MSKKSKRKRTSKRRQAKPSRPKKRRIIVLIAVLVIAAAYFVYNKSNQIRSAEIRNKTISDIDIEALQGGETRATLSPVLFVGNVAQAYSIAKDNRDLLDSIYCYCNCKKNFGHKSLLSCYVDRHAAGCDICRDQAFYAVAKYQSGDTIAEARLAVDKKFWRPLR